MHNIHMIPQGCICRNVLSTFNSVPKIELTWMCTFFTWFPKASLARKLFSILVALASTYQNSVPPIYTVRGGLGQGWITNFSSGSRKPVSILNMFFHVCPKKVWPVRFIITLITFVQFFCIVCFQVHSQITWIRGSIITVVTFIWLFSTVCFQVSPQIAREDAKSHKLHLFDFSPLWIFKCVLKLLAWEDS